MTTTKKTKATDKPKNKKGVPSKYSEELAEKICKLIEEGFSETEICEKHLIEEKFPESNLKTPCRETLTDWKHAHHDFLLRSARARELSAAVWRERAMTEAAEVSAKAEKALKGELLVGDEPCYELPRTYIEAKKILIQELNREAALRDDANFGDRKRVDLSGSVKHEVSENFDLSGLSTEQLEQLDDLLKNAETA